MGEPRLLYPAGCFTMQAVVSCRLLYLAGCCTLQAVVPCMLLYPAGCCMLMVVRRSRLRKKLHRITNGALYDGVHGPTWAFSTFCHVFLRYTVAVVSCTPIKQVRPSLAVHETQCLTAERHCLQISYTQFHPNRMINVDSKVKVKFALEQASKAQRGQRYNSTLSLTSALDGVGGHGHASAALLPGETQYPLIRRPSGPHGWSGPVRPPPGFDSRTVQPVAQSLYRLSYPGPNVDSADINSFMPLSVNFTAPVFMNPPPPSQDFSLYRNASSRTKSVENAGRISWTPLSKAFRPLHRFSPELKLLCSFVWRFHRYRWRVFSRNTNLLDDCCKDLFYRI